MIVYIISLLSIVGFIVGLVVVVRSLPNIKEVSNNAYGYILAGVLAILLMVIVSVAARGIDPEWSIIIATIGSFLGSLSILLWSLGLRKLAILGREKNSGSGLSD